MTLHIDPTIEERLRRGQDAVPLFSYEEDATGQGSLIAPPALADALALHFASAAPLSPASLAALDDTLRPYLATFGYVPERGNRDVYRSFYAISDKITPKIPEMSTVLTKMGDSYQNLTTIDLPRALRSGCVAYGYIEDGRILSLAVTHTAPTGACAEITLETARDFRGRGYGKAVLAAIRSDLLARKMTVVYRARENNTPSVRAALSAGFSAAGLSYRYLGRRV